MQQTKIKTIDIDGREWFDKVNGNSYFSTIIYVTFEDLTHQTIKIPFQYGYGDQYIQAAQIALIKAGLIPEDSPVLWRYCNENNITLWAFKKENCLKRDVKNFTN